MLINKIIINKIICFGNMSVNKYTTLKLLQGIIKRSNDSSVLMIIYTWQLYNLLLLYVSNILSNLISICIISLYLSLLIWKQWPGWKAQCTTRRSTNYLNIKILVTIHYQGLRVSLGAFKTSPVDSLYRYLETDAPSLQNSTQHNSIIILQILLTTVF